MQMEMERVQMMASDSIDSVGENSFGGNRRLALMVKSRSLVLPKSLTLYIYEGGDRDAGHHHHLRRRGHLLSLLRE